MTSLDKSLMEALLVYTITLTFINYALNISSLSKYLLRKNFVMEKSVISCNLCGGASTGSFRLEPLLSGSHVSAGARFRCWGFVRGGFPRWGFVQGGFCEGVLCREGGLGSISALVHSLLIWTSGWWGGGLACTPWTG